MSLIHIQEWFDKAVELPERDRQMFLASIQKKHPGDYEELASLLEHHQDTGSFLDHPIFPEGKTIVDALGTLNRRNRRGVRADGSSTRMDDPEERLPKLKNGFEVIKRVGKGGMGVVYQVRQTHPFVRDVAVKLVKRRNRPNEAREFYERFRLESQALAMMSHDHIAKVFDAGKTAEGEPYIVMEFIDGLPITDYCNSLKLSIEARVELFLQVCDGVQHAHMKGVIHGDLKPTNILVSEANGHARVKIIDFGIARATAPNAARLLGDQDEHFRSRPFGALAYMSPEQTWETYIPDTRSDLYALGVVLFELITNTPLPEMEKFRKASYLDKLHEVRYTPHPKPSDYLRSHAEDMVKVAHERATTLDQLIRTTQDDLDWITTKSLSKDADNRYESVTELKLDLNCFLNNYPVSIAPDSQFYRLNKLIRRNAFKSTLFVLIALTILAIIVIIIFGRKLTRAEKELSRVQDNLDHAISNSKNAASMFESILFAPHAYEGGRDVTLLDAVRKNESTLERYSGENPEMVSKLRMVFGNVYFSNGNFERAAMHFSKAYDLRLVNGLTDAETARAMDYKARALYWMREDDAAEASYRDALQLWRQVAPPNDPNYFMCLSGLGSLYLQQGKVVQAVNSCRTAYLGLLQTSDLDNPNVQHAAINLALALKGRNDYGEALVLLKEVLCRQTEQLGDTHPKTLLTRHNLAELYRDTNQDAQAKGIFWDVFFKRLDSLGPTHPHTMQTQYNLTHLLIRNFADYTHAAQLLDDLIPNQVKTQGEKHEDTLMSINLESTLLKRRGESGDYQAATDRLYWLREVYREKNRLDSAEALRVQNNLADTLTAAGRAKEAVPVQKDLLATLEKTPGISPRQILIARCTLGEALLAAGEIDAAVIRLAACHQQAATLLANDKKLFSAIRNRYALALLSAGRLEESENLLRQSLADLKEGDAEHQKALEILRRLERQRGNRR